MRTFLTGWGLVLALAASVVAFSAVTATASANGLTAAQLQAQGWTCVLVPVENLLHCRIPAPSHSLQDPRNSTSSPRGSATTSTTRSWGCCSISSGCARSSDV